MIQVTIESDFEPEKAEEFEIVLSVESGNAILASPSNATVIINANDNAYGTLSLKTTQGHTFPVFYVNEDSNTEFSDVVVIRNGGTFNNVSIVWILLRNDSHEEPLENDIFPTSGIAAFVEGQKEQTITFNLVQDNTPEVNSFQLRCRHTPQKPDKGELPECMISEHFPQRRVNICFWQIFFDTFTLGPFLLSFRHSAAYMSPCPCVYVPGCLFRNTRTMIPN